MKLLIGSVMVYLIELTLFARCANLCSNSSLAVEKIGLNFLLIKLKYHEQAILPTTLGTKEAKIDMLSLRYKCFVERPGGNFRWQGPRDRLLWVHGSNELGTLGKIRSISLPFAVGSVVLQW